MKETQNMKVEKFILSKQTLHSITFDVYQKDLHKLKSYFDEFGFSITHTRIDHYINYFNTLIKGSNEDQIYWFEIFKNEIIQSPSDLHFYI